MIKTVYLSLGSNLGDREAELRTALIQLHRPDFRIERVSPVYETKAVDLEDQADFLNIVAEARADLFPLQLLSRITEIESAMGRRRIVPKGPRNIDIDILLFGRFVVDTPRLQIPHPRMTERRFVLAPLADLAPGLRHPISKRTIAELLAAAPSQFVLRLARRLDLPFDVAQH